MDPRVYLRGAAHAAFHALGLSVEIHPVLQFPEGDPGSPLNLPALVYSILPGGTVDVRSGAVPASERWRLDVRSSSAAETEKLDRELARQLRNGPPWEIPEPEQEDLREFWRMWRTPGPTQIRTLGGPTEDYDDGIGLYRRLRVVEVAC